MLRVSVRLQNLYISMLFPHDAILFMRSSSSRCKKTASQEDATALKAGLVFSGLQASHSSLIRPLAISPETTGFAQVDVWKLCSGILIFLTEWPSAIY